MVRRFRSTSHLQSMITTGLRIYHIMEISHGLLESCTVNHDGNRTCKQRSQERAPSLWIIRSVSSRAL